MVESEDGFYNRRAIYKKPLKSMVETEVQQKPQRDSGMAMPGRPKRAIRFPEKINDFIMVKPN